MIRFLELSTARSHRDVTLQSIINITYLADVPWYRERLRDLGLIPLAIALVRADPGELPAAHAPGRGFLRLPYA